jgi:predicted metal-dependent HD superfamily phosphohydrolase
MNYQQLLKQVSDYALDYFQTHTHTNLIYHNRQHTEYMAGKATQIANHYQLTDRDYFAVLAACWFHDLGYMIDINRHEEESAAVAEAFLRKQQVSEEDITAVKNCIMATKMPQQPANLLEKITCDADLFHLGTDDFADNDKKLLKEINALHGTDMSRQQWRLKTIQFLEDHYYHTDYCQVLLNDAKNKHLQKWKAKAAKAEDETPVATMAPAETAMSDMKETAPAPVLLPGFSTNAPKVSKKDRPDKGIETMFRISSSNHQRLSDMADNKAHIMITVNSIILSAIISLLLRRLSDYEYLIIPTFILLSVSLLTMTFSILATRPSLPPGLFTRNDVDDKKVNLLFFGNFYKMGLDDYTYGMVKMMEDKDFLYGTLIKDVYTQGVVLGKKYRLLRIAYNIFMFGLIGAVIAFIIASAWFNSKG